MKTAPGNCRSFKGLRISSVIRSSWKSTDKPLAFKLLVGEKICFTKRHLGACRLHYGIGYFWHIGQKTYRPVAWWQLLIVTGLRDHGDIYLFPDGKKNSLIQYSIYDDNEDVYGSFKFNMKREVFIHIQRMLLTLILLTKLGGLCVN